MNLPPATIALYLAALALSIKFTLGAMQSGTFNSLLAKFSLPPIPTAVFPWLGAGLGLAAGIVKELQAGDTLLNSIAVAIIGMLTGGVATMHGEFLSGRTPVLSRKRDGGSKPNSVEDTIPPTTPVPSTPSNVRGFGLALGALFVIGVLFATAPRVRESNPEKTPAVIVEGCAWWATQSPSVVTYTEQDAMCVLGQLFTGGAIDPAAIVLACAPATLEQVIAILDSIIAFYITPAVPDAGTAATASNGMHCGSGTPPVRGMPQCVAHEVLLRVMSVRVGAHARLGH